LVREYLVSALFAWLWFAVPLLRRRRRRIRP
jgi:hypothetical protein